MRRNKDRNTPSRTSPKGGRRGCLCWDTNTYSIECCDGSLRAQGIGNITTTNVPPDIAGVPTIAGTAKVGETLTATLASVTGNPTPTDTLQWQRSDDGSTGWSDISGATSTAYTAVSADENKYLRVVQTATNLMGSATANSASTTQVAPDFEGLLDTYSGATAAYSLRLLRAEYSGSAIRVRRSNDNEEQDIGFINSTLDTSALATFCGNSDGFVTTWYEQSGADGASNMIQAIASNQPKIYNGATESVVLENSKPTIEFDYTSAQHFKADPTNWDAISDDTNHTIIMVYNLNQYNSPRSTLYNISGNVVNSGIGNTIVAMARSSQLRIGFYNRNETSWTKKDGFYQSVAGAQNGVQYLLTSIFDTEELQSFANSTIEATNPNNPEGGLSAQRFFIGANSNKANPMDGNMQEYIIWNSDQTENKDAIENEINGHYSIY